jgi:predicted site-specific integrase-resolvase
MELPDLTTYLPLHEAAERYNVAPQTLHLAIKKGTVRAAKTPEGEVLIAGEDVGVMSIEVQVDADLQGKPIRVTEAADKYQVDKRTLGRWASAGYVRIIEQAPKLLLLDESDVKRAAHIFHQACRETGSYVRAGWVLKRTLSG